VENRSSSVSANPNLSKTFYESFVYGYYGPGKTIFTWANIFASLILTKYFQTFVIYTIQLFFAPHHIENFWNIFWIPLNFLLVSIIVETMNSGVGPNPNLPTNLQEKIDKIFNELLKMTITWVNILVGLFLGENFCEDILEVITLLISLTTWYGYLKLKTKTHFYAETIRQYDFL
jgi:hypothetical protein